jgi:hypothetical protein
MKKKNQKSKKELTIADYYIYEIDPTIDYSIPDDSPSYKKRTARANEMFFNSVFPAEMSGHFPSDWGLKFSNDII